jgi:hypothetical protein
VPARQVNRPELPAVLRVSLHYAAGIAAKFKPMVQR